jgi:hypothetical protein
MKLLRLSLALMAAVGMVGCVDTSTVVTVNPDGSGTIAVREYFSPQMLEMMDSMTTAMQGMMEGMADGMASAMGDETNAPRTTVKQAEPKTAKPATPANTDFISQCIENSAAEFGPGVKLLKNEKRTNASGWKGYAADYAFADVTQLQIPRKSKSSGGEGGMSMDSGNSATPYRFEFVKGPTATLKLVPQKPEGKQKSNEPGQPSADAGMTASGTNPEGTAGAAGNAQVDLSGMGEAMAAPFMTMLKGARFTFLVRVKGTVVETNARYKSALDAGAFTLYAVNMDEAMKDKAAAKLLSANDPSTSAKFASMDVPGIKVEDPAKTITIAFK